MSKTEEGKAFLDLFDRQDRDAIASLFEAAITCGVTNPLEVVKQAEETCLKNIAEATGEAEHPRLRALYAVLLQPRHWAAAVKWVEGLIVEAGRSGL